MRDTYLAYLRDERAKYIRRYRRGDIITTRQDARSWALFYSGLIRKYGEHHA